MKVTVQTTNKQQVFDYYKSLLASVRSATKQTFLIYNDAFDPNYGVFYFKLVDEGRPPIRPVNVKYLTYLESPGNRVFSKGVAASRPRRITDNAQPRVQETVEGVMRSMVQQAASENRLPDATDVSRAVELAKKGVLEAYIDATRNSVTGENFEREDRMIDHFKIKDEE